MNKLHKIFVGVLLITFCLFAGSLMTGCSVEPSSAILQDATDQRLNVKSYDNMYYIVTDEQTGVQYLDSGEAAVVMVDKDGKPLINNNEDDQYK